MAPAEKIFYFIFPCVGLETWASERQPGPLLLAGLATGPPLVNVMENWEGIPCLSLPSALFSFVFFEE